MSVSSAIAAATQNQAGSGQIGLNSGNIGSMFSSQLQGIMGPSQAQLNNSFNNLAAAGAAGPTGDPNNLSASSYSNDIVQTNTGPTTPGVNDIGVPPTTIPNTVSSAVGNIAQPITTGGFSPQTQNVAQGIFGNQQDLAKSVQKQKLINLI
jgi:hypothetical protein